MGAGHGVGPLHRPIYFRVLGQLRELAGGQRGIRTIDREILSIESSNLDLLSILIRTLSRAFEKNSHPFGFLWIDRQACILSTLNL
jgi:hypothetical protein